MKFKMSCNEATTICDKSQYGEASFWEKAKLTIHIFLCKKCGKYSKQNTILTKCYDNINKNNTHKQNGCLCDSEKKAIEKKVKEVLKS